MSKMSTWVVTAWALTTPFTAACGNLTAGGFTGEATVIVSGDADTLSAAASPGAPSAMPAMAPASGPSRSFHEDDVEGSLRVDFTAYLVRDDGGSVQLGDDELEVEVDLRGRTEVDAIDRQRVPATRYVEFRLVFSEIRAEVQGLVIDSVVVPEVHVELEHLSLEVSRPIDLFVDPGSGVELVVDLNALAWLDAVEPLTGAVDETVFQGLVNVVAR